MPLKPYNEAKILMATPHLGSFSAAYHQSSHMMEKPGETMLVWQGFTYLDDARNIAIQRFLATKCSHILFVDSDMAWHANAARVLYEHDKDICSALYYMRAWPYSPVAYWNNLDGTYRSIENDANAGGLLQVDMVGAGFLLIKRHVIEAFWDTDMGQKIDCGRVHNLKQCLCRTCLRAPDKCNWFPVAHGGDTCVKIGTPSCPRYSPRRIEPFLKKDFGEDVFFCRQATRLGFEVWVDLDLVARHVTSASVIHKTYQEGNLFLTWEGIV